MRSKEWKRICSAVLRLPAFMTVLMNFVTSALLYTGSSAISRLAITRLRGISVSRSWQRAADSEQPSMPARRPAPFSLWQLPAVRCQLSLRFRPLGPVLRPALPAALDADGVERAAYDVVAHSRQILDATAADEHQRVLLQVVPDTRDIGRHLDPVGEPDARDLAQRRVRFLGRLGEHPHAHTPFLRVVLPVSYTHLRAHET